MPTITLKNIPSALHSKLKKSAIRNRHSLNSEIIVCLETVFNAPGANIRDTAESLKAFTSRFPRVDHSKVDIYKRQGRA
jgi:hypothetical protein